MVVNVGVIGTGMIGTYHIERLSSKVASARVVAVHDLDGDRAERLAGEVGAKAHAEATDIIADDEVDAVLVTSPGSTHAPFVLECIRTDKPVFTEKPLATEADDALEIMEAEIDHGSRLVQVGFMRRFDAGYRQIKAALDGGRIGEPLMVHNVHRNPEAPPGFTSAMLQLDSVVHEIDVNRWLLDEGFAAATVLTPRAFPHAEEGLVDPQFVILEMVGGAIVTVDMAVNARYGYDVRCEVLGSEGTATLETPSVSSITTSFQRCRSVPEDWRERFDGAFHTELQEWVTGLARGTVDGPSAWDGYAATVVTNTCVVALESGQRQVISLSDKPDFYA